MKFRKNYKNSRFSTNETYVGIKNNYKFSVSTNHGSTYYVMVNHKKFDIRFNSLWSGIFFTDLQSAFDWCEEFNSDNFECLGSDVK
jgi:hypothetical protein